ncbi:hypothetical protein [Jatrophihabitans sp.]|uniref:hypothetical protein n=1 Tax=Jatrophihabitans sp. TaxID=1932789 RepID=UPI002CA36536|nr:hypothetical protein [Jatrophihabitans sp.]
MTLDELPAELRSLGDAAQEVLLDRPAAVRQLAPVPLLQLGTGSDGAAEPHWPPNADLWV